MNKRLFYLQSAYMTYFGEKAIVPMLNHVLDLDFKNSEFRADLVEQLAEEAEHVKLYHDLLETKAYQDKYFGPPMVEAVKSYPYLSQKVFAFQVILENIAKSVLLFRLDQPELNPTKEIDQRILKDEEGHINLAIKHIEDLKEIDGELPWEKFQMVIDDFYKIFRRAFHPKESKYFFQELHKTEFNFKKFIKSDSFIDLTKRNQDQLDEGIQNFKSAYYAQAREEAS